MKSDQLVKSLKKHLIVIPARAGIHSFEALGSFFSLFTVLLLTAYCLLLTPAYGQDQGSLDKERLGIIKSDIKKEIEYNEKLKKDIEEAQKGLDEAAKQRLLKVSKIYEAMPPEEAAKALEKLDEDTAAAILSSLKPRTAGGILAQMDSDKAASISKKIITKIPKAPK